MATKKVGEKEKKSSAKAAGKAAYKSAAKKPEIKKVSASKNMPAKFYEGKTGKPVREPGD